MLVHAHVTTTKLYFQRHFYREKSDLRQISSEMASLTLSEVAQLCEAINVSTAQAPSCDLHYQSVLYVEKFPTKFSHVLLSGSLIVVA